LDLREAQTSASLVPPFSNTALSGEANVSTAERVSAAASTLANACAAVTSIVYDLLIADELIVLRDLLLAEVARYC
jgi:hypothetical protein